MQFPESVVPVFLQIPIAVWIGLCVHRTGRNLLVPSIVALAIMIATVWLGAGCPGLDWTGGWVGNGVRSINETVAAWPVWVWVAVLLSYCYVASVLPVWVLLQPRDYINSLQLITSLCLIVTGLFVVAFVGGTVSENGSRAPLEMVAPTINLHPSGAVGYFSFNGSNANFVTSGAPGAVINATGFTVSAWVWRTNGVTGTNTIITNCTAAGNTGQNYILSMSGSGTVHFHIYGTDNYAGVNNVVSYETWTHLAGVVEFDGVKRIYKNGVVQLSTSAGYSADTVSSYNTFIGSLGSYGNYHNGRIGAVKYYKKPRKII